MQSTTSTNSQAVLGINTSYDSMLAIESLILSNPMMNELRDIAKLTKTTLCKMALMEFISTPVSSRKLKRLFNSARDDDKFRAVMQGGQLE
jgi:hypothetical protein